MQFVYEAVGKSGRVVKGRLAAASVEELQRSLSANGLELVEVQRDVLGDLVRTLGTQRLKAPALIELFGYLHGLMAMGLNTLAIWKSVEESIEAPRVRQAVGQIRKAIDQGFPLAEAMERTGVFPALVIGSVRAGESSGALEKVFQSLERHYREEHELAQQVWKATLYPLVSLGVLFLVGVGILIGVVPQLKTVFPANPPLPTRVLLALSDGAVDYWWGIPLLAVVAVLVWTRLPEATKARILERLYGVWGVGPLLKNLALTNVFFNFSLMLGSGVPLLQALDTIIPTSSSHSVRRKLEAVADIVRKGGRFSDAFRDPFFPSMVPSAMAQGETTGKLDVYLDRIATFLRDRTRARLQMMASLIEPALLLVGGVMVLFLALGVFMPIYGQLQGVRR